jgi:hypothetical protein
MDGNIATLITLVVIQIPILIGIWVMERKDKSK